MKILNYSILAFISLFMFSCQPKLDEKVQLINKIDTLEFQIYKSSVELLDERKPNEVLSLYKNYANLYPEDSISVVYLFKAAQVEVGLGLSLQAISTLDSLIMKYPNAENIPSALQFKAFRYDDRLGNINEASKVLDVLIENYPNSSLIENAKAYKASLGKSPEEIIREMEAKDKVVEEAAL